MRCEWRENCRRFRIPSRYLLVVFAVFSVLCGGLVVVAPMASADEDASVAVWRPSNGTWYIRGVATVQWGRPGDIPVPGDYNHDGNTDLAVWRPSNGTWYIRGVATVQWGRPGDIPVPGDYNHDGNTDLAVWRPSDGTWRLRHIATVQWGRPGDIPVPGDYNHDGKTDPAVWRPSDGTWHLRHIATVQWGRPGDMPVPGDYNHDGKTDPAVWRPSDGTWHLRHIATVQWGRPGDMPVPGDYNHDGKTDPAVWRPSDGTWHLRDVATVRWGQRGDIPAAAFPARNQLIAAYAKTFVGRYPYVYGGQSPTTGFDCSGLTYYIYRHYGRLIATTAQGQYNQFRRIGLSDARPGDLIFFHDGSGYVFHVGVYEGSNMMVAAATPQDGIRYQGIWSSNVTYGTITH